MHLSSIFFYAFTKSVEAWCKRRRVKKLEQLEQQRRRYFRAEIQVEAIWYNKEKTSKVQVKIAPHRTTDWIPIRARDFHPNPRFTSYTSHSPTSISDQRFKIFQRVLGHAGFHSRTNRHWVRSSKHMNLCYYPRTKWAAERIIMEFK